jgi:plastocyanin
MKPTGLHAIALLMVALAIPGPARSQNVDVRAQVLIVQTHLRKATAHSEPPDVVLWLDPLTPPASYQPTAPGRFRIAQKNKSFQPHLLVIPLGSTVAFPNLDPFFHNVFSQFNGKRFDLGLYEAGSTRDVHFDHEGVSYIFCNIHPEMSAVIITLSSPWYAISSGGNILLREVPPGLYEMRVWASGADARQLDALKRRVRVGFGSDNLGTISVQTDARPAAHKNKFGDDYRPEASSIY